MSKKKYDWPGVEYGSAEYHRLYRAANSEKLKAYHRAYSSQRYITHQEQEVARRKRWAEQNPEKIKAQHLVSKLKKKQGIHKSKWPKLVEQSCQVCGDTKVNGHHPDYTKPAEVIWLCPTHHHGLHKQLRDAAKA